MRMLRVLKSVLLVICLSSNAFANCNVQHELMYAIAEVERHTKKNVGYPYLISFNNFQDFKEIPQLLNGFAYNKLDNRTIDCLEENNCIEIARQLIDTHGITNLDMGAYQICYYWNKLPYQNYFDLIKNYNDACYIIEKNVKQFGHSWESIAKYHSFNKERNKKYAQQLQNSIIKNYPELTN